MEVRGWVGEKKGWVGMGDRAGLTKSINAQSDYKKTK